MSHELEVAKFQVFSPNSGQDSSRLLIEDKFLYFQRPRLIAPGKTFTWPIGVESFRRTGNALLGIHRYIGDNHVEAQVINLDEARIEMSGTFPGRRSRDYMLALIDVLTSVGTKILYLPGVFLREQYVTSENYEFSHGGDDRTHSIDYSVTFIRGKVGEKILSRRQATTSSAQPSQTKRNPRRPNRWVTVTDGMRTFRAIAQAKYGDADKWRKLVELNDDIIFVLNPKLNVLESLIPIWRWPVGTKFRY